MGPSWLEQHRTGFGKLPCEAYPEGRGSVQPTPKPIGSTVVLSCDLYLGLSKGPIR